METVFFAIGFFAIGCLTLITLASIGMITIIKWAINKG